MQKIEVYNIKDIDGIKKFNDMTSKDEFLSEMFNEPNKSINATSKRFIKKLGFCITKSLKKMRINKTHRNKALEELLSRRRVLR